MNKKLRALSKNIFEQSICLSLESKHSLPKKDKIQSMIARLGEMIEILDKECAAKSTIIPDIAKKSQ